LGVGFLPERQCQPYIASGELVAREVANPRQNSPLSVAWKAPVSGKVIDEIVSLFRQKDPLVLGFTQAVDYPAL
jgi:LysR family transcriptional activator of the allD operon